MEKCNCLERLPGVHSACDGHGDDAKAYVRFENGMTSHGIDALLTMKIMKRAEEQNKRINEEAEDPK